MGIEQFVPSPCGFVEHFKNRRGTSIATQCMAVNRNATVVWLCGAVQRPLSKKPVSRSPSQLRRTRDPATSPRLSTHQPWAEEITRSMLAAVDVERPAYFRADLLF